MPLSGFSACGTTEEITAASTLEVGKALQRHQLGQGGGMLVGGAVAHRGDAPLRLLHAVAIEREDRVGVADVDGEQIGLGHACGLRDRIEHVARGDLAAPAAIQIQEQRPAWRDVDEAAVQLLAIEPQPDLLAEPHAARAPGRPHLGEARLAPLPQPLVERSEIARRAGRAA